MVLAFRLAELPPVRYFSCAMWAVCVERLFVTLLRARWPVLVGH